MKENIFDLTQLINKKSDQEIEVDNTADLGPETGAEWLKEYEMIEKTEWEKIPKRTYVRYQKKDGTIPKGGFVNNIWRKKDNGQDILKIDLVNNFSQNNVLWSIYTNAISKIWKKIDSFSTSVTSQEVSQQRAVSSYQIDEIKEDIAYCKKSIEQIIKEIQKINNEHYRIVSLIKKLNDKIS